jgi:hypothetical protein
MYLFVFAAFQEVLECLHDLLRRDDGGSGGFSSFRLRVRGRGRGWRYFDYLGLVLVGGTKSQEEGAEELRVVCSDDLFEFFCLHDFSESTSCLLLYYFKAKQEEGKFYTEKIELTYRHRRELWSPDLLIFVNLFIVW